MPGGTRQLARFDFELTGIFHDLGGFIGHRHQVLDRDAGPADDLADHRMRRGGAHRSGQRALQLGELAFTRVDRDDLGQGLCNKVGVLVDDPVPNRRPEILPGSFHFTGHRG